MDIRILEYFLAVAREGSITKAAKSLNMTQPPLSRQMKDLEVEIGTPLFIRDNKTILLTEEGKILKKRAEEIVSLFEKTKRDLINPSEDVSGEILIGAAEIESISFIANLTKTLLKKHPRIRYKLYSGDAMNIREKLDKGLIDFGLFIGQTDMNNYTYVTFPPTERWGVIMREDSELAMSDSITASQLYDKPLILVHRIATTSEFSHWLKKDPRELNVVLTYDLAYNASLFVKKDLGYMIGLDNIVNTAIGSGLAFRPLSPSVYTDVKIAWKKNQVFGQAARAFLEELKNSL